ncbi:MAG: TfoX/Sxy family protein [Neomegalonema sp.]|nr:TfoX/Sxy family protein [Neomegalonema sp.]
MSSLDDDITRAKELFEAVGGLSHRKMFGGAAIYSDGRIFALIVDGELMIKADIERAPDFVAALEAEGAQRWTYQGKKREKPVAMPYWSLPDSAHDDPDVAAAWARRSLESTG